MTDDAENVGASIPVNEGEAPAVRRGSKPVASCGRPVVEAPVAEFEAGRHCVEGELRIREAVDLGAVVGPEGRFAFKGANAP